MNEVIDYLGKQNKGIHQNRIEENLLMTEYDWNNPEKTFAFEWRVEAKRNLGAIFTNQQLDLKLEVDSKTRFISATIIQWLGSNIGWSFLQRVLDKEGYKIVKK